MGEGSSLRDEHINVGYANVGYANVGYANVGYAEPISSYLLIGEGSVH